MTVKATSKQYELKGKYIDIWKKEQGKPVLITEAWNYDSQPEFGAQLRCEQVPVVDVALQPHLPVNDPIRFETAALSRLMEAAVSQHDAPLWAQFYSDNAILFAQGHSRYRGRKEIDEYIVEHTRELPIFEKLDIRNDRIDNLGNYVIEYASHIANWRNGSSSGVGLGKDLRIWRREEGGGLKIFRHIGMYD
jgi:ketosteroid isomerase-like protein